MIIIRGANYGGGCSREQDSRIHFIFTNLYTRKSYAMVYRSEVLFIRLLTSMGIQSIVKCIMNSEVGGKISDIISSLVQASTRSYDV